MTHIEQMIKDMCPHGVEWKTLGEVAKLSRGKVYSKEYLRDNSGEYPVYSSQTANNGELGRINTYDYDGKYLTWTTDGAYAGTVFRREGRFSITNVCGLISNVDKSLSIDFLYYWLNKVAKGYVYQGMGNPKLMSNVMETIEIPLPPLEIQEKIVECLDKFSALAAELQAELQLRRKQYEYYRTQLLTPHSDCNSADNTDDCKLDSQGYTKGIAKVYDWQWKTLGEIGEMIKGSGIQKSDFVEDGKPCIHYGQVHTYFGTFAHKVKSYIPEKMYDKCKKAHTGDLIIATTSEDVEACCKATAWLGEEDVAVSGDAHIYRHTQNPKYMAYLFQTEMFAQQKRKCATGAKVTRVHGDDMLKFRFPFPSLEEQARIVAILDKFEALTTSLSDGIPAEQAAQQKRYEYYRDLLLTFPKAE